MAKVKAPILSIGARGQIGKSQVYATWRGVPYARQHVVPRNPNTVAQQGVRGTFGSLQDLWKRMGSVSRAPWSAYAVGKPLTARNAISSANVKALNGQASNDAFVGSPGSGGGVAPTAVSAAGGASAGDIDVTVTAPPAPTGWTLTAADAFAIEEQDPKLIVPNPIAEGENTAPTVDGDTVVSLTGLTSGTTYVVMGWLKWQKADGSIAYGASLGTTIAAT